MTHKLTSLFFLSSIFIAAFIISTTAIAGKVYKWTGPDGSVHYSQTPPQDNKAKEMKVKTPKPGSSPKAKPATVKADPKAEKLSAEQKEVNAKNEEIKKENCKRASAHSRTITSGGRFYDVNEQGERVYWDDAMLATKKAEAKQEMEKWCSEE